MDASGSGVEGPVVPAEITAELTQILSNLVLGDNLIRQNAEKAVDERLAHTPDLYILALAQFAIGADTEVMRSFSLVLVRRLLFRHSPHPPAQQQQQQQQQQPQPPPPPPGSQVPGQPPGPPRPNPSIGLPRLTLYDHLSPPTLTTLERLLLHSLTHEPSSSVRAKTVDTICDIANQGMVRGRPWHALQAQAFSMTTAGLPGSPQGPMSPHSRLLAISHRESAFRIFASCPNIVIDLQMDQVLSVYQRGLTDAESVDVRLAALDASVKYLQHADAETGQLARTVEFGLVGEMLRTLPSLAANLHSSSFSLSALSSNGSVTTPSQSSPPPLTSRPRSNFYTLTQFLTTLTPLCTSHPALFAPHLNDLLTLMPPLMLPQYGDAGPTPTAGNPLGLGSGRKPSAGNTESRSFVFPPPAAGGAAAAQSAHPSSAPSATSSFTPSAPATGSPSGGSPSLPGGGLKLNTNIPSSSASPATVFAEPPTYDSDLDTDRQSLRLSALEFMLSLSESRSGMVKKVPGWTETLVRACLEGMAELDIDEIGEDGGMNEEEGLREWLDEDPSLSSSQDSDSQAALYEQSLDRLACALGGKAVLPGAFTYIPSMLASYDWRQRHAALMAIGAIAEGTGKIMQNELGKIVDLVVPTFSDPHPRVRYAACQCLGQLCTDLEEIIQEQYHQKLFAVLIPTLEDPEPRVHSHAAAALINFCEGVERDTLLPYLDPIVERLLKMLHQGEVQSADGKSPVKRYVQEQAVTTLAMVADASEHAFVKFYPSLMPQLLNVLQHAEGPEYRRLRIKAMECAGLIAIAVGRDTFRPDANAFVNILIRLQKGPIDPNDTQLFHYLIATWAKVCQAMGPEFEPYLPYVMPSLLTIASAKADVAVYDEDEDVSASERSGWETINMDGQIVGVRTAAIEEKCQAFETMVIYASTLGARFAPYLSQSLEIALPQLRFYFHDGVREACAMLIPMLIACGKESNTLTNQMVSATFMQLISCIQDEHDASFLASLFKAFTDSLKIIGGAQMLPREYADGVMEATKRQLTLIAERRRARANRSQTSLHLGSTRSADGEDEDYDDMALLDEMEDFALEDMGKMLRALEAPTELLIAVSSVKELGLNKYDSEGE